MLIRKHQLIISIVCLLLLGSVIYFLFTPDLLAFQTRVIAVKSSVSAELGIIETYKFVEEVEAIRSKHELGKQMTLEESYARDNEIKAILEGKENAYELLTYLRIYGKSMYLSTDNTGTYQVVFFEVLRKAYRSLDKQPDYKRQLLEIRDELSLNDTDSGEFNAIIEEKTFP